MHDSKLNKWLWLACLATGAQLLGGCGGSGGGSGTVVTLASGDKLVIQSVQAGMPVSSTAEGTSANGPVIAGNNTVVGIAPDTFVPSARMQVWLQANAAGSAVDHWDWEIRNWHPAPPYGVLTNFDHVIDIDPANGRYLVQTTGNRIRFDSPTISELRGVTGVSTQTVVATAWTSEGRFASAYFTLQFDVAEGVVLPGVDQNANGISDVWERAYNTQGTEPTADSDFDGSNNFEESVAGTDPMDPQSVFRVWPIQFLRSAYLVRFPSVAGKRYQVEATGSLANGPWTPQGDVIEGTGSEVVSAVPLSNQTITALRIHLLVDNPAVINGRPFLEGVDTDQDGTPDIDEWAAGTDPFDAGSALAITDLSQGNAVTLSWPSVAGKLYQIESGETPATGTWLPEGAPIPGTGAPITATVEVSADTRYFQVVVTDSDSDLDGITDWEERITGLEFGPWHYRTNHPTDPARVTAILAATNTINLETDTAVANATRQTPGSFVVTRSGSLNALTIHYSVGGDAVPGVDYEVLSGTLTLPAGTSTAQIPVIPLGEAGLNPSKSVVVTLDASPAYAAGSNAVAQVNILKEVALSVKDFGAVGDGVTDDTLAIQAAINALEASSSHNTLYFPTGRYRLNTPTQVSIPSTTWHQLLALGATDLTGRDLLITGEPGAELYSTVSWVRARMLAATATFRSLSFRGLTWRKDDTPLPETTSEPNRADGVSLMRYDLRRVECVEFEDCTFINCHGAVFAYNRGYDLRGRLVHFRFHGCRVLNPYGSNTQNGSTAFGGGQQVNLNQWVGLAAYWDNLFDGGTNGPIDPVRNPGGRRKDGSHFGSPLHLVFTNNIVRRMGIEGVFQTDDSIMGALDSSFVVPPPDGVTTAVAQLEPDFLTTYQPGQILNFRTPQTPSSTANIILLTAVSYDDASRMLTVSNPGLTPNVEGTTVSPPVVIYLQEYSPTLAEITGNVIEDEETLPVGSLAIGANAKAIITENFVRNYVSGVHLYENVHNILFPPTKDTLVENNIILAQDTTLYPAAWGTWSHGPGEIIANNLVIAPNSRHFIGVVTRGYGAWVEGNTVLAAHIERWPYDSVNRSVGIAVGNGSSNTTNAANRTYGLDVGNGPENPYQAPSRKVISHYSTNDTLAIDPNGLLP